MKKVIILAFCMLSIAGSLFCQSIGDVNNDSLVNIIDALLVAQYYVLLDPPGYVAPVETGDVNLDSSVDIIDALIIAQYYVGIITELPAGLPTSEPTATPDITSEPTDEPTSTPDSPDCITCNIPTPPSGYTPAPTSVPLPAGTPAPTVPPYAGLITVNTSDMTVKVCDSFTTTAYLNSGTQLLSSYTVTFTYDYPTIQVKYCEGTDGVTAGSDGFVTNVDNSTPGTLIISGYDSAGTGPGTRLNMFSVVWKAFPFDSTEYTAYKSSFVRLSIDSLLDPSGTTIGTPGVEHRYILMVWMGDYPPPEPY